MWLLPEQKAKKSRAPKQEKLAERSLFCLPSLHWGSQIVPKHLGVQFDFSFLLLKLGLASSSHNQSEIPSQSEKLR